MYVPHVSLFWLLTLFWTEVLSPHDLCSFQLEVGVLTRQLVPSSACHTLNTMQVTLSCYPYCIFSYLLWNKEKLGCEMLCYYSTQLCQGKLKRNQVLHTGPFTFLSKCILSISTVCLSRDVTKICLGRSVCAKSVPSAPQDEPSS